MNKKFAVVGVGGFVAPRHLKAIKETGNEVVAAFDPFDSVGVIDSYFPKADFFVEFERFDRHIEKLRRSGNKVDYVSICSPNYLHDAHIRFALRNHADAICEKPLVLNPWNLDALQEIENETENKIYSILQLRHHKAIRELKEKIANSSADKIYDIDLTYITSRGNWYYTSWKGDINKSGGVATNIGIHFFDMLIWIFGEVKLNEVHIHNHDCAAGYLELENARVKWFLSINENHLPETARKENKRTFRSIQIEGEELEFSDGFTDLHTQSYDQILEGNGYDLDAVRPSIEVVHDLRTQRPVKPDGNNHPLSNVSQSKHPFSLYVS